MTRRRRRTLGVLVGLALVVVVGVMIAHVNHAVNELTLPLSDASVIREQAQAKQLDPALIAAVIEPETAEFLAKLSGGYSFTTSDLGTPKVNVAYGSYYLRYLLDHYEGNEMLAVAAYNAGLANVDRWVAKARAEGGQLTVSAIPFPETRAYVQRVLEAQKEYRATYPKQLGLN